MSTTRMDIDEYRATIKPKPRRSKYGAIAAYRCAACNAHAVAPPPKPKRGQAPPPAPCPACGEALAPIRFDSKAEARCWDNLVLEARAGRITDLKRQVGYPLHTTPRQAGYVLPLVVGHYRADFTYMRDGRLFVVDVKGGKATQTELFRWKQRHLHAEYGIRIIVVS